MKPRSIIRNKSLGIIAWLVVITAFITVNSGRLQAQELVNLLQNPGFESGDMMPDSWTISPYPSSEVVFAWNDKVSARGKYCVSIESVSENATGRWSQTVPVAPETVYALSGAIMFDTPSRDNSCYLQIVFKNSNLEMVKKYNYPAHFYSRLEFNYDFPDELKVRSPIDAVFADINLILKGKGKAWFDEINFVRVPVGDVSGVVTSGGVPLEGARVAIWGEPWGKEYASLTDADGNYVINDVPVAHPRYIIMASKDGYKTIPTGDIDIIPDGTVNLDFELPPGTDPIDDLQVKFGMLIERIKPQAPPLPAGAVIPDNELDYPPEVRPYLKPDNYIDSNHPFVVEIVNQILESLPPEKRTSTSEVVRALYLWIIRNIEHTSRIFPYTDSGDIQPEFTDVTAGKWQIGTKNGWGWAHSLLDWYYKPSEVLQERSALCVEMGILATAMLRAANIPARSSGHAQYWVQDSNGYGTWMYMAPNAGRDSYSVTGLNYDKFVSMPPPLLLSVDKPLAHAYWHWEEKHLFREEHHYTVQYEHSDEGLKQAIAVLEELSITGNSPPESTLPPIDKYTYQIIFSSYIFSLLGVEQNRLVFHFPLPYNSELQSYKGHKAYWTNHPECVVRTWEEEVAYPAVGGVIKYFNIEFDLTPLL
jgi:hypothetical protein